MKLYSKTNYRKKLEMGSDRLYLIHILIVLLFPVRAFTFFRNSLLFPTPPIKFIPIKIAGRTDKFDWQHLR